MEVTLAAVAGELSWIDPPPVFIGGATIGLYLDELARAHLRITKDVDCIVPAVSTTMHWFALDRELRRRGWQPNREGPIGRYRSPAGHIVDLLAQDPSVQGFTGSWFPTAVAQAQSHTLSSRRTILVTAVPWLLACKIEAYTDRGGRERLAAQPFPRASSTPAVGRAAHRPVGSNPKQIRPPSFPPPWRLPVPEPSGSHPRHRGGPVHGPVTLAPPFPGWPPALRAREHALEARPAAQPDVGDASSAAIRVTLGCSEYQYCAPST